MENNPIFTITPAIANLVAEIGELVGNLQGSGEYQRNLHLRKVNRIRSIQSSTAIEGNTLSTEQVEDIISGRRVFGNPREIREVKNAYEAYEHMMTFDPYSVKDFLSAHKYMTRDLINESGVFRAKGVGVFSSGELIHAGANPSFVPSLIEGLFSWAKNTDIHPLILSSIIHFEIEFIHPFADGNGRIGRLWQTLVLSKWHEIFAWIPIETVIYENQAKYYDVLHISERAADSTVFIEFMLNIIKKSIIDLPVGKLADIIPDKYTDKLSKEELEFINDIVTFIVNNGEINNFRAQLLTNKSPSSVKQYFAKMVDVGILDAEGENKGRKYKLVDYGKAEE